MNLNSLHPDLLYHIFQHITLKTIMKYYPIHDSEQNYTTFIIQKYPYYLVNKEWYQYFVHYKLSLKKMKFISV